jgi:hypothetical protein
MWVAESWPGFCSTIEAQVSCNCSWFTAGSRNTGKRKLGKLTLAAYLRIVDLWHPSRNDDRSPGDYKHASNKRVWLQCHGCPDCGEVHEWNARVFCLTRGGGDDIVCPACESRTSFCRCRSVAANKRLAAEWHEDNPSPAMVALGCDKKHRWRCSESLCRHIWEASPGSRNSYRTDCPDCARKRSGKVHYASLADGRPDLVAEWDEGRNDWANWAATGVTCGSDKKAWWVCGKCGGSWQAKIKDRANRGQGCPMYSEVLRGDARVFAKL